MRLKREAGLGIGGIVVLPLVLSMLTITLLMRMGPAIEQILQENVYSGEAVEEMLAALVLCEAGASCESSQRSFAAALQRARNNVTEKQEQPLLLALEADHQAALSGDAAARHRVSEALRDLGRVNRDSMQRADDRARRLGAAGAWAAALLGALAFWLSVLIYRRMRTRIELPMEELRRTTQLAREGNVHARCPPVDAPTEIKQIALDVNWLLDQRLRSRDKNEDRDHRSHDMRRLVNWLLDKRGTPTLIVDAQGTTVAASQTALDSLPATGDSLTEQANGWQAHEVEGTQLRMLEHSE